MAILSYKELEKLGFKKIGKNVLISDKASFYNAQLIEIGDNVRIDDFCLLSGDIKIGNFVHISAYTALYGKLGIEIGDFCGISARGLIYSATDDFSGNWMISPLVDEKYTNVHGGRVVLEEYVQLGANTTVLPSVTIHKGSVTGACSLVKTDLDEWGIYVGIPVKRLKNRSKKLLEYAKMMKDKSH